MVEARADQLAGGPDGSLGVVVLLQRGAEDGHDPVAHVGDQGPSGLEDRLGHLVEVVVDHFDHPHGGLGLGEAREAPQVREQDCAVALDAAEAKVAVGRGEDLLDDLPRDEAREHVADPFALDRFADVEDRQRAEGSQGQGEQRIDEGQDSAVVERDLGRDREDDGQRRRVDHRAPAAQAEAAQRHRDAEQR